jgi:tetratricopeptide (TPR) repeat protein
MTVIGRLGGEEGAVPPGESPGQLLARARDRFALGDYRGTVWCCEQVIAGGRPFADAFHLMGVGFAMLGQPDRALEAFDQALLRNPRYLEALVHRALALSALGRAEEAQGALAHAAHLAPPPVAGLPAVVAAQLANRHAELARAYEEAGRPEEAIAQYRRALELGPEYHDLRYRLARALLETGAALEAREELERVLAANDGFLDARVTLGLAHYMAGDELAARRIWRECLVRRPSYPRARTYLAMLDRKAR